VLTSFITTVVLSTSLAAPCQDTSGATTTPASSPTVPAPARRERVASGEVAAQFGDDVVTWAELDALMLARHALGPVAEEPLAFLAQSALIERLGREAGIEITAAQIEARYTELDRLTREGGVEGGLSGHLEREGVARADFLEALRDQLVLAELTRRALRLPADRTVPDSDQAVFLEQQMSGRSIEPLPRPWKDDVVARFGDIDILGKDLAARLRNVLGRDKVRDALFQLALAARVERECKDLPREVREAALTLEIAQRRADAESDPRYQGVSFDALLSAQGLDPAAYASDPSVRIAALSTLVVDTRYAGDKLEQAYLAEKEWFDGQFGESIEASILFAVTSVKPDGIVIHLTREQARARLADIAAISETKTAFAATVAKVRQDESDGIVASDLGRVQRTNARLDAELRETIFRLHSEGVRGTSAPVDLSTGVAVFFIGEHRPTPPFAELRDYVHTELRRRLLVGLLPAEELATYVDPEPLARAAAPAEKPN
jgi:hypothetical protein